MAIFFVVFFLYSIPLNIVAYAGLLSMVVFFIGVFLDFFSYVKKYQKLKRMKDEILFELDRDIQTTDLQEAQYCQMIEKLHAYKEELESKIAIDRQETTDYYTLWVHQIKVPIAAMRLLLQSGVTDAGVLSAELFQIEQYVEMVLSYLRMESMSGDMLLKEYDLSDMIKQSVRKYSKLFILKKIQLELQEIDLRVLTDEKWMCFVIEQLLSNALKYTQTGKIAIYMDKNQNNTLVIEDTGIGISQEDLPRVTEKGFTGYNGRLDKKSTGLGLYLCKTVLDKLGHSIRLESEPGAGTKVYLKM